MRRNLVYLVVFMFLLTTALCLAGDVTSATSATAKTAGDSATTSNPHGSCPYMNKGTAEASSANDPSVTATGDAKTMGGCPMMNKQSGKAEASTASIKPTTAEKDNASAVMSTSKATEAACPAATAKTEMSAFHEVLNPMQIALKNGNYAEIKSSMPKLIEASKGLATCKCPMSGKCTPECAKAFDTKKAMLLKAVDDLDVACKGDNNEKINATFTTMNSAYVDFTGMCNAKTEKTEVKTAVESK